MSKPRIGNQTPTTSVVIPYEATYGKEAIDIYNSTSRTAREWQEILIYDILSYNDESLWMHTKFGYEIPRRNGKGEILVIRELYGLMKGERILHTAHRTTTSHSAWERLCTLLDEASIEYKATKQMGLETIKLEDGGYCNFRTRSSKGGLGEGYDTLIIDEAQEYTIDQESALKYVVTDSMNPQTLFCGTPPTAVSSGTVFMKMRDNAIQGQSKNTGWAEWSVDFQSDPNDIELWYQTNPSLGQGLSERAIEDEITSDPIDFNIQRLGLWLRYNQKSAISQKEWEQFKVDTPPVLKADSGLHLGIKYGYDGKNVSMSLAVKLADGNIFVESIGCKPIQKGNEWIIRFIQKCLMNKVEIKSIVIDGENGQSLLVSDIKEMNGLIGQGIKKAPNPILPRAKDVIIASATFEQGMFSLKNIRHYGQPSLVQSMSNCEHRAIGSNGGFGYRSIKEDVDVGLVDSVVLAYWSCSKVKEKKKQIICY